MGLLRMPDVGSFGRSFDETTKAVLRDVLPREFFERFYDPNVVKLLSEEVLNEYDGTETPWIGKQFHAVRWWILSNGKAVAWVRDPVRGWSFPTANAEGYI